MVPLKEDEYWYLIELYRKIYRKNNEKKQEGVQQLKKNNSNAAAAVGHELNFDTVYKTWTTFDQTDRSKKDGL